MKIILLAVFCLTAAPAAAQSLDQRASGAMRWQGHEVAADRLSTGLVAGSLAWLTFETWRYPCMATYRSTGVTLFRCDRRHAFIREAIAIGVTVGIAEATKRIVHRTRPDGSDDRSFFSEHTALASIQLGRFPYSRMPVVFTVSVGAGRMAASKHFASDVAAGAAAGWLVGRLSR